nr:SDR family oxidoreductase [Microlunatus panaciterrae]
MVAGGSRGLGLELAAELGRSGSQVVVCARSADELDRARDWLAAAGIAAETRVCDVSDREAVADLAAEVERTVGPIETVLCVAGVIQVAPYLSTSVEDFEQSINTMLWGPINVVRATLPAMRRRGRGNIGIITSIGGVVSVPHLLPYSTAKFGAVGFSQGLRAELAGSGISVTTVIPGLMRTGSQQRAQFGGQAALEYAWFAPAASLPLLSISSQRAARIIVRKVLAGRPTVILTPAAKVAVRLNGLSPGLVTGVLGLAKRLLPRPPGEAVDTGTVPGWAAERRLSSPVVRALTALGRRAAARLNQAEAAE